MVRWGFKADLCGDRFFWLALYAQPALWVGLAVFAIVRLENVIWLSLVGECGFHFSTISVICKEHKWWATLDGTTTTGGGRVACHWLCAHWTVC